MSDSGNTEIQKNEVQMNQEVNSLDLNQQEIQEKLSNLSEQVNSLDLNQQQIQEIQQKLSNLIEQVKSLDLNQQEIQEKLSSLSEQVNSLDLKDLIASNNLLKTLFKNLTFILASARDLSIPQTIGNLTLAILEGNLELAKTTLQDAFNNFITELNEIK